MSSSASKTTSGQGEPRAEPLTPEELIGAYQAGIWRYLRALGCNPAEADDLTQDTFVSVLKKPFEQFNPSATAGYLRRVAYNRFISVRRRERRVVLTEQIQEVDQSWNGLVSDGHGELLLDTLRTCLEHLPKRARWALEMRFRDQLTRAEIAAALEITEDGAKNLMQRAKKQLRECVEGKIE
jgi:RNA polymerase sigma-70 factor (ECF subfamily)